MQHNSKIIASRGLFTGCMLFLLVMAPIYGQAQQKDSTAALKQFMDVCNSYKQVPLHAGITVRTNADIVTSPDDTTHYTIEFYIHNNDAYVKLNGEEEVINDSLMLFISHKLKSMTLYPNTTGHVAAQLSSFTGMLLQDSAITKMAGRYQADILPGKASAPGTAIIQVKNRLLVPGTSLPKETIEVVYNSNTRQPVSLVQLQRKMIPLDSATYTAMVQKAMYPGKLIHIAKDYYFLMKELSTEYLFTHIDYDATTQLPLQMNQCVAKDRQGKYVAADGYRMYRFSDEMR